MRLFDTHVHLNQIDDVEGALRRAKEAEVDKILIAGLDLDSNKKVIEIYESIKNFDLYFALGIHPYLPQKETFEKVYTLIEEYKDTIIALGEIGLDYTYKEAKEQGSGRDLQKEVFRQQLALAKKLDKPVIVHSRAAWNDCFEMVMDYGLSKVLFHWYTGPLDILERILDKGYYISVSPAIEYSKQAQAAALNTPNDRILLETDSPVRYRPLNDSYISEPKDVLRTLIKLSELKKINKEKLAEIAYSSSCNFFNIDV
jgi:TatD DNase family protein